MHNGAYGGIHHHAIVVGARVAVQVPADVTSPATANVHVLLAVPQIFPAPVPQMHGSALVTVPSLLGHAVGAARKYL